MSSVDSGAIEDEIARLRSLDLEGLRREWRRLYHREPPRISRDLSAWVTDFRNSRRAGSASRHAENCKPWQRPCGQMAGLARPQALASRSARVLSENGAAARIPSRSPKTGSSTRGKTTRR